MNLSVFLTGNILGDTWGAIKGAPGKVVGAVADSAVGSFAEAVAESLGQMITTLGTFWVRMPTPVLAKEGVGPPSSNSSPPPVLDPTVQWVQDKLWWLMTATAVLAVIIGGARMAWERRAQPGKDLLHGMITLVVVTACGVSVIALATQASDEFAKHLIDASLSDGEFAKKLGTVLGVTAVSQGAIGAILVIVIGLFAILVSIAQIVLMAARWGLLVLMAGALPLAASFTSTEAGRTWFRRFCAWTLAFILYKPTVAVIYATMFRLMADTSFGQNGPGAIFRLVTGVSLMALAIFALPALMRFLAPMTAAAAGGGGGGMGAVAMAALPTGAIALGAGGRMLGGGPAGAAGFAPGGNFGGGGGGGGADPSPGRATGAQSAGASSGARGAGSPDSTGGAAAAQGGSASGAGQAAAGGGAAAAAGGPTGQAVAAGGAAAGQAVDGVRRGAEGLTGANTDGEQEGPRGSRD